MQYISRISNTATKFRRNENIIVNLLGIESSRLVNIIVGELIRPLNLFVYLERNEVGVARNDNMPSQHLFYLLPAIAYINLLID